MVYSNKDCEYSGLLQNGFRQKLRRNGSILGGPMAEALGES